MDIRDFERCKPEDVALLWFQSETAVRTPDSGLWFPKDLKKRMERLYKDSRGEPSIVGRVVFSDGKPVGFILAYWRELNELEVIRGTYPSKYVNCPTIAVDPNADVDAVISLMINDIVDVPMFRNINHFYFSFPCNSTKVAQAIENADCKRWTMLARKEIIMPIPVSSEHAIKQAVKDDIPALAKLCENLILYHWECDPNSKTTADLIKIYQNDMSFAIVNNDEKVLLAEYKGKTVGLIHALCQTIEDNDHHVYGGVGVHGYIATLAVEPEFQREGIGTALLNAAMVWLKTRNATMVQAHYILDNPKSSGFWTTKGFKPMIITFRRIRQ